MTAMGGVLDTDVTLNMAGLTLLQKNFQGSIFGHGNRSTTSRCSSRCIRPASSTSTKR